MKYAEIADSSGNVVKRVVAEPKGWGLPYQKLFEQTLVSGYDIFLVESHNNFDNDFQKELESLYQQRIIEGKGGFGLILRDIVRNGGKGIDDKGRLNLSYVSHANTKWEKTHDVRAPKNGWYVPNDDCEKINGIIIPFQPGTVIPFETIDSRDEAVKRFEQHGVNPNYVSYFFRLNNYNEDIFVGRRFGPLWVDLGRFFVFANGSPSYSGDAWVASLPAHREQATVMKVNALPQK